MGVVGKAHRTGRHDVAVAVAAGKPACGHGVEQCDGIDGTKCVSCRMCATFCPTGAIAKFDDADGTLGVTHTPGDCVKCGSCRDVCPADAITLLDAVPASWLTGGNRHRYVMTPRPVSLTDNPTRSSTPSVSTSTETSSSGRGAAAIAGDLAQNVGELSLPGVSPKLARRRRGVVR